MVTARDGRGKGLKTTKGQKDNAEVPCCMNMQLSQSPVTDFSPAMLGYLGAGYKKENRFRVEILLERW